jgi:hypothetical protein
MSKKICLSVSNRSIYKAGKFTQSTSEAEYV